MITLPLGVTFKKMSYEKLDKFLRSEDSLKAVQAEALRQRRIASSQYAQRQALINKNNAQRQDGHIKGFGNRYASVDANSYFQWLAVDPHFWDDPANIKKLRMTNPEIFKTNG